MGRVQNFMLILVQVGLDHFTCGSGWVGSKNWIHVQLWEDCYIWYSVEGHGRDRSPARPLLAVPNAHPLTASVPITLLLYNGPVPCGFNVTIERLIRKQ